MKHQPPDWAYKIGHSEILEGRLFIGGEDDIDELLYGEEEARNINGKCSFIGEPSPQIDTWIDLRDIRDSNREVFIPSNIEFIQIPFRDGVYEEAKEHLPYAQEILKKHMSQGKRTLVSCHQGRSRTGILLIWFLCEEFGDFQDAYWHIKGKRPFVNPDKEFQPFLDEWNNQYKNELKWPRT